MKYIPTLASRDAEIEVIKSFDYDPNFMPHIMLIKKSPRKNSKKTYIEMFTSMNSKFFIQPIKGTAIMGNIQEVVKEYTHSIVNEEPFMEELKLISSAENLVPTVTITDFLSLRDENQKYLLNNSEISIVLETISDLASMNIADIPLESYIFVMFNPNELSGMLEKLMKDICDVRKERIVFVRKEDKRERNIKISPTPKKYKRIVPFLLNDTFKNDIHSDFCGESEDFLPTSGGVLSPGVAVQIDDTNILHSGMNSTSTKDAKFEFYTDSAKHISNSDFFTYKKDHCMGCEILDVANKEAEHSHYITPIKSKIISMIHYAKIILDK